MTQRESILPPLADSSRLPVQIAVYVPSTRIDEEISQGAFRKRIQSERRWMDSTFGGDTTIRGSGGYLSQKGNLISESVAIVEASTTPQEYRENREKFAEHIKERKRNWKQESIGFEIEGTFFVYPDQPFAPKTNLQDRIDVI